MIGLMKTKRNKVVNMIYLNSQTNNNAISIVLLSK